MAKTPILLLLMALHLSLTLKSVSGQGYLGNYEHLRVKRGAAYPGGHGDFSGVAKMSTFASLGAYGGFTGHGSNGQVSSGYSAGGGGITGAGGITISNALGSYGGYLGQKGPTVISSGGFGNGGLLFGKS